MERHHKRSPRRAIATIAAVLAAGTVTAAVAPDAGAAEGFELSRVAGANRYATAASLATDAFPSGSDVAVLATGENFADALAGSFLAGRFGDGAPILLTTRDALPNETKAALDDLEATTVYILGGTGAVSQGVEDALGDRTVVRVAGANRYETAADIATLDAEGAAAPGELSGDPTVIVASGEGFADALASGPLAFVGNLPVLLTPAAELSDAASAAIDDLGATRAVVAGGTAAVSAAVVDELEGKGMTVQRVAGPNRYATAVAVANLGRSALGLSSSSIDLASGENFPDALAAGPASGAANRPLLLTASDELSGETETYLVDHSDTLTTGRVFGGTAAISQTAVDQAEAAGSSGETLGAQRVVGFDKAANTYTLVQDGASETVVISYHDADDFTVDGVDASVAGFETNLTVGDIMTVDDLEDPSEHDLTNVSAASFTSGTVGNVDLQNDQLDIIDPVTGVAFRSNITYSGTFRVDAGAADMAAFEAAVDEGDTIEISGGFNLTNATATGSATDVAVTASPSLTPGARFTIDDALGDIPATGDSTGQDNDGTYFANCAPTASGQAFTVDGNDEATCDAFSSALSAGDTVSYARAGGIERFTLVNVGGAEVEGTALGTVTADGDGASPPLGDATNEDGGSFDMVDDDGTVISVEYGPTGTFLVDGLVSNEATFEADYSAGDEIVYRAADAASSTTQRLELTNDDLQGAVSAANTESTATIGPDSVPAESYVVAIEGEDAETVPYGTHDDSYFVNGASKGKGCFEAALDSAGDHTIERQAGDDPDTESAWVHRLTVPTLPSGC
jgi:putative cell wall-binding protein